MLYNLLILVLQSDKPNSSNAASNFKNQAPFASDLSKAGISHPTRGNYTEKLLKMVAVSQNDWGSMESCPVNQTRT